MAAERTRSRAAPEFTFGQAFAPPRERPSKSRAALAERGENAFYAQAHCRRDPLDCTRFEDQAHVEAFVEYLGSKTVRGKTALEFGIDKMNDIMLEYVRNHSSIHNDWNGKSRDHAVTLCTLARGYGHVLNAIRRPPKKEAKDHAVNRRIYAHLVDLGVDLYGNVTGVYEPVSVAGAYGGYTGTCQSTHVTQAVSLSYKLLGYASSQGKVHPVAKDYVACTLGDGSMTERKPGHVLVDMEAGNFTGAKRGVAELCPSYSQPREARALFCQVLSKPLPKRAWMCITGAGTAWQADALKLGAYPGDAFACDGFDASKISTSGICKRSDPKGGLVKALAAMETREPVVRSVYQAMALLGELPLHMTRQTRKHHYDVICQPFAWLRDVRDGHSPLMKGFDLAIGDGPIVYGPEKMVVNMTNWDDANPLAKKVALLAGVASVADLTRANVETDKLVVVDDSRGFAGGAVAVPKPMASPGGTRKRKRKAPEAKAGPRVFKCVRKDGCCAPGGVYEWSPETPSTTTVARCPKCNGKAIPKETC